MPFNNRRTVTNTRTVNYSPGGLNERFATLAKSKKPNTVVSQRQQPQQQSQAKSVFSRIKAAQPANKPKNIQQQIGKALNMNNRKLKINSRVTKPNTNKKVTKQPQKQQKQKAKKDVKKSDNKKKKPLSAEDLDKSLDAYMMKDPKTAQAKLDEELTSYMNEAALEEEAL
ncbi:hypothetical protein G6F43_006399 [Rhizopus delemar]|nr:hypothetical protein G6F43_006399 [Rhizopus delemar]